MGTGEILLSSSTLKLINSTLPLSVNLDQDENIYLSFDLSNYYDILAIDNLLST